MTRALTKAMQRTGAIATEAFDRGITGKAAVPSVEIGSPSPLAGALATQNQQLFNERYAMMSEWVYSAINALAGEAAGQPVVVARLTGKNAEPGKKKAHLRKLMTKRVLTKTAGTEFEILPAHPFVNLLEHPNDLQEKWQFIYSFMANLMLTGWAYVVVSWSKRKKKLELYSLPSTWVTPVHEKGMFSEFKIWNPKAIGKEPVLLDRSQVGFAMLPNPSDPLAALAPASAQVRTLRIHEQMLNGQEAFFRNGIFPSVIVTMAQEPYRDVKKRPVLTNVQRRMIHRALRQNVMGDMNQGAAFIVDGLIEDMKPFSLSNREMGWDKTEERVKSRILSAFGVHEFILGAVVSVGGHAQAEIIETRFYKRVNTYLDMLGSILTNVLGSLEQDENLLIWYEKCQAENPERRNSNFLAMRVTGDVSKNELRAEVGLPPDEDEQEDPAIPAALFGSVQGILTMLSQAAIQKEQASAALVGLGVSDEWADKLVGKDLKQEGKDDQLAKRSMLLNSVGGMTGTVGVLTAVGQGVIGREQAANMLALFLQIPVEDAMKIVPEPPPPPPEPETPPETPPGPPGQPLTDDQGEQGGEQGQGEEQDLKKELALTNLLLAKALEEPEEQAERILRSVECR